MSNETTANFLKVMSEFKWPEPSPISYRLYYNDDGSPRCYTMEDLPGKYIEVDVDTYINHTWNVSVQDGKLLVLPKRQKINKLVPSHKHGIACHPGDVCVVTKPNQSHKKWNLTTNEIS